MTMPKVSPAEESEAPPLGEDAFYHWLDQKEDRLQSIFKLQMELSGLLYEAKTLYGELHTAHPEARDEIWGELQPIQNRIASILQQLAALR